MKLSNIQGVMFDLDGTLLNTIADIANAMNRVLLHFNLPTHAQDEYYYFVGAGIEQLAVNVLPPDCHTPEMITAYCQQFRHEYSLNWHDETAPYGGVHTLLSKLQERGYRLAILSNKPDSFTKEIVSHFFPMIRFEAVQGQLKDVPTKPDPTAANIIAQKLNIKNEDWLFVGDSGIDMETAVNSQMVGAGALWGFRTKEELATAGAKLFLSDPLELLALL